jgi:putative toxin-antitoxin system antitoxin component (TIGR02293 family)
MSDTVEFVREEPSARASAIASEIEQEPIVGRAADLLGGTRTFRRKILTRLDAHEVILDGFPGKALTSLTEHVSIIRGAEAFEKALGVSMRTFQRKKKAAAAGKLSQEQSGRAWKFAEIVGNASEIFGSIEEAEEFMERPAVGLNQNRPIDLLATPAGVEMVETYLQRVRYGVYM